MITIIVHSTNTCNAIAKKYERNQLMCMFTHIVYLPDNCNQLHCATDLKLCMSCMWRADHRHVPKNIKLLFTNIVLRYTSCLLCNIQIPITYILLNNALNGFDNFLLSLLSLRPWPRLNTDPELICEFLCIENKPQWSMYFYIITS